MTEAEKRLCESFLRRNEGDYDSNDDQHAPRAGIYSVECIRPAREEQENKRVRTFMDNYFPKRSIL